jgi:hypothetical protein
MTMSGTNVTFNEAPAPLSSVQIEGRAKGPPAITVKVYAADVTEAARVAQEQYDALVERYRGDTDDRDTPEDGTDA